jgi:hypothetical protein
MIEYNINDFDGKFGACEIKDVGEKDTCGDFLYVLTDEDIEKLKIGKVLFDLVNDEYGVFIAYKKGGSE